MRRALLASLFGTFLIGCTAGDGVASVDGSAALAASRTADVRVLLTDAPAAYDHVYVDVVSVALHATGGGDADGGDGWTTIAVPSRRIDLLALQNGVTTELGGATIPAGSYDGLRLVVSGGAVTVAGSDQPLTIPSGAESGLKLAVDETFTADSAAALTVDFDAGASIVDAHGKYLLKPVLRIAARQDAPR